MSAAVDARGLKRVCSECGSRFYDFNKRPIICPSCETEFTGEMKVKGRRGRAAEAEATIKEQAAEATEAANDKTVEEEATNEDVVSLDDAEEVPTIEGEDDEAADLENIEDEDLGDLGKDLGDLEAGIELDEDEDDIDADLGDVKKVSGGDDEA